MTNKVQIKIEDNGWIVIIAETIEESKELLDAIYEESKK